MTAPLTPADCDLRDFAFQPIDVRRLLTSETWIMGTGDERSAAITLWLECWHQVPAASVPNNDRMLAHLSQAGVKWGKVKKHALRGWVDGGDGRLYHPVVAEKALAAWIEKLLTSISGAAGNAKRWAIEVDTRDQEAKLLDAIQRLRAIAPQSPVLKKKQVVSIATPSKSDRPPIKKSSPPDSSGDRKREGEGYIDEGKPSSPRAARDDDHVPVNPGEWVQVFADEHGVELDHRSIHDRKKFMPLAAGWVAAGVTVGLMRQACAQARAMATEPIAWLPAYADRVLATLQAPPRAAAPAAPAETFRERDERLARERWERMTGQRHPDSTAADRMANVIDITPTAAVESAFPRIS